MLKVKSGIAWHICFEKLIKNDLLHLASLASVTSKLRYLQGMKDFV